MKEHKRETINISEQNTEAVNDHNNDLNIEDTVRLMTEYKSGGSKKRLVLIVAALIAVIAVAGIGGYFTINNKNYDAQIELAEKSLREGDYEQAETAYLSAVSMNKRKPKAREGLAFTYALTGRFDDSKAEYETLYDDTGDEKYKDAAADAAEERIPGDSSLAVSGVWRDVALEDIPKYDDLDEFINQFYIFSSDLYEENSFDFEDSSDSWVLLRLVADDIVDFSKYADLGYGDNLYDRDASKPDPRGWIEPFNQYDENGSPEPYYMYSKRKAEDVDWIAANILNIPDESIKSMLAKEEDDGMLYLEGDYYYSPYVRTGLGMCGTIILDAKTDGEKYCIEYEAGMAGEWDEESHYTYLDPSDENYQHKYALMELKTIGDEQYWTMYYTGKDLPSDLTIQSNNKEKNIDKKTDSTVFSEIADVNFTFSSGAGGWGTELQINKDGSFSGNYHDSEMGVTGDDYPNGTIHVSNFSGQFTEPEKVSEYIYRFKLKNIDYDEKPDKEYIKDGTKYIAAEAYGISDAETVELYLPGADASDLPGDFIDWMLGVCSEDEYEPTLKIYGLYNVQGKAGFAGRK